MLQTSTAFFASRISSRELLHRRARQARLLFEHVPVEAVRVLAAARRSRRECSSIELLVVPVVLDEDLQHAVDERDVAALRDGEPVVADLRAEHGARRRLDGTQYRSMPGSRYGLTSTTFVPCFFASLDVLHRDRLVVGRVRAEEDRAGRCPTSPCSCTCWRRTPSVAFIAPVRGRVAQAGGVVDVVRAEEAGHLLPM